MTSIVSLLMLLTVTIPVMHSISNYDAQDMFPHGQLAQETSQTEIPNLQDILNEFQKFCPPLGSPDERFRVTVMGTLSPPMGGCASMQKFRRDEIPGFNLWLGDLQTGSGNCDDDDLDYYMFQCLSKHSFIDEDENIKGWYVTLFDPTARWSGRIDYKCSLYSTIKVDPPTIQMVISANHSCDGLAQRMANVEQHRVPEGLRNFEDGSVALLFSKNWPQPISELDDSRKKRSAVHDSVHRFPDWSQESWLDLQVHESLIRNNSPSVPVGAGLKGLRRSTSDEKHPHHYTDDDRRRRRNT